MKVDKAIHGFSKYVEKYVLPTMDNGQRIAIRTFLAVAKLKPDVLMKRLTDIPAISLLIEVDDNGEIDVESILHGLKEAIRHEGLWKIETNMIGKMTFAEADVDELLRYLQS